MGDRAAGAPATSPTGIHRLGGTARAPRTLVPALLAAIAYVDPGNFGVNISSGSEHGYALVWVVVFASLSAMVIQYLAAKLGMVTGRSLAEHSAARYPGVGRVLLWAQAEVVVVMTDLAEIVGGAIALRLLFGVPLVVGAVVVTAFSLVVLALTVRGRSHFDSVVLVLLVVIVASLVWQVGVADVDSVALLRSVVPGPLEGSAALLAVGIVGATVMPHALHFHSAATRGTDTGREPQDARLDTPADAGGPGPRVGQAERLRAGRQTVRSVVVAMTVAGAANVSLVVFSAGLPGGSGASIDSAYAALQANVGQVAATVLAVALLASGLASTLVGVQTGDVVMEGFGRRPISPLVRRGLAVVPALVILGLGVAPTTALVWSQVVLSFALPGTLVPLLLFTRDPRLMGALANRRPTTAVAAVITAVIVGLCAYLVVSGG
ncbi:Nramp family divalent metal transporter [Terracoccus luteus]|uniref:Manganese transport protein n=1 Tax=Terracoccus luteus TaxID=53356 RepID=A0A839PX66_9MICO|nr:Nramp family divalent metal transporter [Terracoccus luteus]MBB2987919.1 manganese transport protein [Terracoccus luteus]MCP2173570.1 manganese transport protein [Terracoccus luteus]